eukprot:bmy_04523T0
MDEQRRLRPGSRPSPRLPGPAAGPLSRPAFLPGRRLRVGGDSGGCRPRPGLRKSPGGLRGTGFFLPGNRLNSGWLSSPPPAANRSSENSEERRREPRRCNLSLRIPSLKVTAGKVRKCLSSRELPCLQSNFRVQLFEDPTVEVEIQKKVLKIYNKREEDFPSLREYNDFLEEVEEIVFNLTNNVDLDNTKKKMEIDQKENKDVIQKNKLKLTREQEELEEALEVERQENEQRRLFIQKEEQLQQILKRKNKKAFLDELESSDLSVALLLAQHKHRST